MLIVQFAVFVLIALGILAGAHYFLYFSLTSFFSIVNVVQRHILLYVMAFLTVSYFIAAVLDRLWDNVAVRAYYFASGFWLGLLTNLVLAALAVWIILGIVRLLGIGVNSNILAVIFFLLAAGYSTYGAVDAFRPQIKEISVVIPSLPPAWQNQKIVQLSDIHLGQVHRQKFLSGIMAQVNALNPRIVAITGDLFDGMDGNIDALVKPLDDLTASGGIFFVTGNHEIYLGVEKAYTALAESKARVLKNEVIDLNGLKLIGLNYPQSGGISGQDNEVLEAFQSLRPEFSGQPNILLYHSPVYLEEFQKGGVNLMLSGHTHAGQLFPFSLITRLVYHGYDYGLHRSGGFTLYTSSGIGTWGPPMRTNSNSEIVVITLKAE